MDYEEMILARQEAADEDYNDTGEATEGRPLFILDNGRWILNPELYPTT